MAHNNWNDSYYYDESSSNYDDEYDDEYDDVEYVDLTEAEIKMLTSRLPSYIKPTSFSRVENNFIWNKYNTNKKDYNRKHGAAAVELSLWHATSEENAESIAENNFDWRLSQRGLHGYGVSFSTDAGYSNFHCNNDVGDDRALILTNVLVGKKCKAKRYMEYPKNGCDTAVDKNELVYVKFDDHVFYPAYVVYYNNRYYKADSQSHAGVPVNIRTDNY